MAEKQSTEGEPMFVESIMSSGEWRDRMKRFKTSLTYENAHKEKPNPFKWRHRMGEYATAKEIEVFNKRMEIILKKVTA